MSTNTTSDSIEISPIVPLVSCATKGSSSQLYVSFSCHTSLESFNLEQFLSLSLTFRTLTLGKNGPAFGHSPLPSGGYFFTFYLSLQLLSVGFGPKELLHHYQKWNQDGIQPSSDHRWHMENLPLCLTSMTVLTSTK